MKKYALVLGGGIAGLSAALGLADAGYPVCLVTEATSLGGKITGGKLSDFNDDCILEQGIGISTLHLGGNLHSSAAIIGSFVLRAVNHPNIEIHYQTKAIEMSGSAGDFLVTLAQVDNGQPLAEKNVGVVLLAAGFAMFDAAEKGEYGYGRYRNVITSLEMEQILAQGRYKGVQRPSDGTCPQKVAFIQCVGSRDVANDRKYCSGICCMYTAKEAIMLRETSPDTDVAVFYMDTRACGKNFDQFLNRAKQLGTRYVRAIPADIKEDPINEDLGFRYMDEGQERQGKFDLIVLANGIRPALSLAATANVLGIALNEEGFVAVDPFQPVLTSRQGIFNVSGAPGPLEIAETLALAEHAVAKASLLLGQGGEEASRQQRRLNVLDKEEEEKTVRTGVFLCRGGLKAMGAEVPAVADTLRASADICFVTDTNLLCRPEKIAECQQMIREQRLNRVVVGPCIFSVNGILFQEAFAAAGINRAAIETVHPSFGPAANENANTAVSGMIKKAAARVKTSQPLHWHAEPVVPRALVVGGGVSGLAAALELAERGFPVALVERETALGGYLRRFPNLQGEPRTTETTENLIAQVTAHEKIKVLLQSSVKTFRGRQGRFVAEVDCSAGAGLQSIEAGAVILATGSAQHRPEAYLYGCDDRVLLADDAATRIAAGSLTEKRGRTYTFIQCADSRNLIRPYCSRTCCIQTVENAILLKTQDPQAQITIFYRDMQTPGFFEERYLGARRIGIIFVQYKEENPPQLTKNDTGKLKLAGYDPASRRFLQLEPDLVILAGPQIAQPDAGELADIFHIQKNNHGFLMETHSNLGSIAVPNGGIFVAGVAHSPQLPAECLIQARGVAARAAKILQQPFLRMGGTVAKVDIDKCAACLTCVRVCPFDVPVVSRQDKAMGNAFIDKALCRGCGMCAAECPNKAIELHQYEVNQLYERTGIALAEVD
ncbi:MAG: putative glutamate synthase small subunit [Firmicutes bacterium]|nr:putative glutamate synthase small subunit [Bacillota bacterium]